MRNWLLYSFVLLFLYGCKGEKVAGPDPADAFVGSYSCVVNSAYSKGKDPRKGVEERVKVIQLRKEGPAKVRMYGLWNTVGIVGDGFVDWSIDAQEGAGWFCTYSFSRSHLNEDGTVLEFSFHGEGSWIENGHVIATKF